MDISKPVDGSDLIESTGHSHSTLSRAGSLLHAFLYFDSETKEIKELLRLPKNVEELKQIVDECDSEKIKAFLQDPDCKLDHADDRGDTVFHRLLRKPNYINITKIQHWKGERLIACLNKKNIDGIKPLDYLMSPEKHHIAKTEAICMLECLQKMGALNQVQLASYKQLKAEEQNKPKDFAELKACF